MILYYRFSRNFFDKEIVIHQPPPQGNFDFSGSYLDQHALGFSATVSPGPRDGFILAGEISIFSGGADPFLSVLLEPGTPISGFQDSLQSVEYYSAGLTWNHKWTDRIDTSTAVRYSRIIINEDPLFSSLVAVGCVLSHELHGQLGWSFSQSSLLTVSAATATLSFSWNRPGGAQ